MTTVLITRPEIDAGPMAEMLLEKGYMPVLSPLFEISYLPLKEALPDFAALAFTSANGVRAFAALSDCRPTCPAFAIGEATAAACEEVGFKAPYIAKGDVVSLSKLILKVKPHGPVLQPRGKHVAGDLVALLEAEGQEAFAVQTYEAIETKHFSDEALSALNKGTLDWVSLMSPRTALVFERLVQQAELTSKLSTVRAACLSPAVAHKLTPSIWGEIITSPKPNLSELIDIFPAAPT